MLLRFRGILVYTALLFLENTFLIAQSTLFLRGTVSDPTGAVVPGASLRLESPQGVPVAETSTDARGNFALSNLSAGDFNLIVPATSGFAARRLPLHMVSSIAGLKIALSIEAVTNSIAVGPSESSLSTNAAANKDNFTLSGTELGKLPVFDRNYIAALTPFLDPSSFSSGGVTIVVDGVEMKSAGVSPSAIQEVRINNDPYAAEFSRPGRGRIEIITKPGSPNFHGELDFLFRDATLNAKNYFAPVRPPEQRRIYEGHLTGPVGHGGHTTFMLSGERREEDIAVAVHAIGPNGAIDENVQTPNRNSQLALRVTRDLSDAHRISLQYNIELSSNKNATVGGIVLPEAGIDVDSREDDLVFNDRIIVTPNLVNQLQITLEKDEDVARSVTNAQSIDVSGAFTAGGAQQDQSRTENTIHINNVVSWSHRNHYIRFGASIPQISRRAVDDRTNRLGTFNFASLASYTSATPAPFVFTVQQGTGRGIYWINEVGGFFQDQIKLSNKLQVSLGLRYDWQTYLDDYNNFSPRISTAYAPGKGKTILRTGAGIFYDRTGGDFPSVVKLYNGTVLHTFEVLNPSFLNPIPANANLAVLPSNIVRFDPRIRSPYAIQYSFGIERQLNKSTTITAGYRGQVQVKSFRSRDANAPILPRNPTLNVNYPRPDLRIGQFRQVESGGRQLSNAFDLAFRGHAGRWFSGQAQYTLSRAEGNTGGLNFFPEDQYQPNDEWARMSFDRLHRFDLLGNINPDHWLTLGIATALYSGSPYTTTNGTDFYHTGLGNARPAGGRRNDLQGGGNANLNLSWNHEFKLTRAQEADKAPPSAEGKDDQAKGADARTVSLQVSAFNLLNRTNYAGYIGNLSSPLYGHPTAAGPARQLQFEVGYTF